MLCLLLDLFSFLCVSEVTAVLGEKREIADPVFSGVASSSVLLFASHSIAENYSARRRIAEYSTLMKLSLLSVDVATDGEIEVSLFLCSSPRVEGEDPGDQIRSPLFLSF